MDIYKKMKNLIDKILDTSNFDFDWVEYNVSPAVEFLYNKFMESKLIEGSDGWTRYIDPDGKILFVDNIESGKKDKVLYFSDQYIYKKLEEIGLDYKKMKALVKDMLWEIYKRKVDAVGSSI